MTVKKRIVMISGVVFIVVTIMLLVFIASHRNQEAVSGIQYEYLSDITSQADDSQNYWSNNGHNFARGEDGYYFLTQSSNYLMYFDESTKDLIPVCAKADCSHNDTECNAYLGNDKYQGGSVFYYQGYIYLIRVENGMSILQQNSADGSVRKDIASLMPWSSSATIYMTFHAGYAYVYDLSGHLYSETEEGTEQILQVSLTTGETKAIYEISGSRLGVLLARCYGDKLFFIVQQSTLNTDTNFFAIESQGLYVYDFTSGETSVVSSMNISDYAIDTEHNQLYYYVNGKGLYQSNLTSEQSTLLYSASSDFDMCNLSFDGTYLYLNNMVWCNLGNEANDQIRCIVMDLQGNIINEIPCSECRAIYYGDDQYMFACQTGDGASNGLSYIDKSEITSVKEWTRISETEINLIDPQELYQQQTE